MMMMMMMITIIIIIIIIIITMRRIYKDPELGISILMSGTFNVLTYHYENNQQDALYRLIYYFQVGSTCFG